ncbi:MAG: hypothetical protein ABI947_07505 [Chloroflexota bacterium]
MRPDTENESPHVLYEEITHELEAVHQAMAGKLFGLDCIKINGKTFAGFYQDSMTFKLTGTQHSAALKLEGSKLFDPSGMQRPMKEWVQVIFAHAKEWHHFAESALEYVKATTNKPSAKKK